jgi:hypothetical protein
MGNPQDSDNSAPFMLAAANKTNARSADQATAIWRRQTRQVSSEAPSLQRGPITEKKEGNAESRS